MKSVSQLPTREPKPLDSNRTIAPRHGLRRLLVVAAASGIAWGGPARGQGFDRIQLEVGTESGRITKMSSQEITLDKGAIEKTVPVNRIVEIRFDREPRSVAQARIHVSNRAFENAMQFLDEVDLGQIARDEIKEDVEFLSAYAQAKLALNQGQGHREAGKVVNDFVRSHPDNFHYYEAVELMGELLVAMRRYDLAEQQFAIISEAPWPDFQLKAAVLVGQTKAAQENFTDAIAEFDRALAIDANSAVADEFRLAARLGRAVGLAETGKADEGIEAVTRVIASAPAGNAVLLAKAFNALGRCHLRAGQEKDALLAFLQVHLLYNGQADAHAEALFYLSSLWETVGRGDEARKAKAQLAERYASSAWARKAGS